MAPKRKSKRAEESEEEEAEVVIDDDDDDEDFAGEEEEEEAPKKKRKAPAAKKPAAAAKKPRAKKEKVEKVDVHDLVAAEGGEAPVASPAKPKKAAAAKVTEPTELEDGFTAHPPSLLYKQFGEPSASNKIAAFDFDGTLVQTKSGNQFPTGGWDWVFYNAEVPTKLKQYHEDGYRIVIFTNQGGVKGALAGAASQNFRQRISSMLQEAGVPATVLAATLRDELRKPDRGMWDFFVEHFMDGQAPDMTESFYVGDDFDGSVDSEFAATVGVAFRTEKAEFGERLDPKASTGATGGGAGGTQGASQGPVTVSGTGTGPNAELINIFQTLTEVTRHSGKDKAHFAAKALSNVAEVLQTYPHKITQERLKEVGNLKGVGKSSLDKIKEYLATGTMAALSGDAGDKASQGGGGSAAAKAPKGKEGKQMETKGRAEALNFM